jgi:hypothetical protein
LNNSNCGGIRSEEEREEDEDDDDDDDDREGALPKERLMRMVPCMSAA